MNPSYRIAVGIGNTTLRYGVAAITGGHDCEPQWQAVGEFPTRELAGGAFSALPAPGTCEWLIASVCRPAEAALIDWIGQRGDAAVTLRHGDLPLVIDVQQPERVGMDRLVAAVAANRLRLPGQPAIVIDTGTAITVNLLDGDGVFKGGAILPSPYLSARALATGTDQLPAIDVVIEGSTVPEPVGRNTEQAIRSGLFWGAVGGIDTLVLRIAFELPAAPAVILTGGGAATFSRFLSRPARHVPDLVLRGIWWSRHGEIAPSQP